MVEQGVRINDFGVILRGNHYYNDKEKKEISPNDSNIGVMAFWLALLSTIGTFTFVIYDQWAMLCMGRRIFQKYVRGERETKAKGI